jgi:hypothetical protein
MKTVLFLYNSSMYALRPWLDDGRFNVVTVDFDDTDHSGEHRGHEGHERLWRANIDLSTSQSAYWVEEWLADQELDSPSFILSFAPCTDLAVSGARHFAAKRARDPMFQDRAVVAARLVESWTCPSMVENPVSVLATQWKAPTGYVHPWFYALSVRPQAHPEFPDHIPPSDLYNKKTGLWCQNGACMPVQNWFREPPVILSPVMKLGGKSARTKYIRSLSPRGMMQEIYAANVKKALDF